QRMALRDPRGYDKCFRIAQLRRRAKAQPHPKHAQRLENRIRIVRTVIVEHDGFVESAQQPRGRAPAQPGADHRVTLELQEWKIRSSPKQRGGMFEGGHESPSGWKLRIS